MAIEDDEKATLEDLEAEFRKLADTIATASARRQELDALIRKRKADAAARLKVASMDALELEALKRVLSEG